MRIEQKNITERGTNIKERKLLFVSMISLIGFVFAVFYYYKQAYYMGKGYPFNTFLFTYQDYFNDFFNVFKAVLSGDPYYYVNNSGSFGNYFPSTYILMYFFTLFEETTAINMYFSVFLLSVIYFISKIIGKLSDYTKTIIAVISIGIISYPFLMVIDRGNVEGLVFIFIGLFLVMFIKERYVLSSLFLACAVSMKAYPIVLAVLFVARKKYREAVFSVAFTTIITLVSFIILKGGFEHNYNGLINGLNVFNTNYINSSACMRFSSSIWGMLKIFASLSKNNNWLVKELISNYFIISILYFTALSVYVVFIEKRLWKSFALLVFSFILLPYVSYDYKLIYIILVISLYISSESNHKTDYFYMFFLSLLLIPKGYYIFWDDTNIQSVINPLIMILISIFMVIEGVIEFKGRSK